MRATTRGNNPVTRWDPTGNFSCDLGQDCTEFYEDGLIDYYFQSTRDGGSSYTPGDSWTDLAGTHQSYSGYRTTLYGYFVTVWVFEPPSVSFWLVEFAVEKPHSYTTTDPHTQESLNEYTEGYREGWTGPMPAERNVGAETMAPSPGTGEKVKPVRRPVAGGSSGAQVLTQAVAYAIGDRYEVQAGDSLSAIAQRVYNDSSKWPAILAANPQLQNANVIFPGQVLNLPGAPARSDYSLVQQGEYDEATANRDFTAFPNGVPAIGGVMTQDSWKGSAWQPWTQNLYAYVGNNPVNYVDPTGHNPLSFVAQQYEGFRFKTMTVFNVIVAGFFVYSTSIFTIGTGTADPTPGHVIKDFNDWSGTIENIFDKEHSQERLNGAYKETVRGQKFQGKVKEWDHRDAVNKGLDGLRKLIKRLKNKLEEQKGNMSEYWKQQFGDLIDGAEDWEYWVQSKMDEADEWREQIEMGNEDLPDFCD